MSKEGIYKGSTEQAIKEVYNNFNYNKDKMIRLPSGDAHLNLEIVRLFNSNIMALPSIASVLEVLLRQEADKYAESDPDKYNDIKEKLLQASEDNKLPESDLF